MSQIKNNGLDQYGAEPLKQQQVGPAGTEGVNSAKVHELIFELFCLQNLITDGRTDRHNQVDNETQLQG